MGKLNLEAYGLQEMSRTEASMIDGGWWQIILASVLVDAMINSGEYSQAIADGWNAARQ